MRPPGSASELEARRLCAAEYFHERKPLRTIARLLGASLSSVKRWKSAWKAGGVDALAAKPHPPRSSKLSEKQKQQVIKLLRSRSARRRIQNRFVDLSTSCPTGPQAIWREVPSRPSGTYPARAWFQPTETEAGSARTGPRSRRTVAKTRLAAHQKKAERRRGASIVFIDETGFRLQPVNRRTWAPCGKTPVQRAWDRYDRLSVIGTLSLSLPRGDASVSRRFRFTTTTFAPTRLSPLLPSFASTTSVH